ncbi:MAG: cadherin-like domain-containing protein, partial [Nitrososphaera sp.]|nr:cadherin-like domain-containing protein [Nitrososphaera sp.]
MRDHDSANDFLVVLLCSFLVCALLGLVSPAISNAEDEGSSYDSRAGEDDTEDQDQDSDHDGESAEDEYAGYDNDGGDQEEAYSDIDDGQETPQPTMGTTHHDDEVTISEDEIVTVNVLSNDGLVLGHRGSPTISEVSSPSFGTVIVNYDSTITYAPFQTPLPAGYEKHDSFQYTVSFYDGSLYTGTVTIWINQTNDPPIAYSAEYTTVKNKPLRFVLPAHDEDNDDLTFVILTNTTFGELDLDPQTGQVVYTPREKYDGRDRLTFTVSDGTTSSSVATIGLIISDLGGSSSTIGQQPADNPDDEEDDPGPEQNSTDVNSKPSANAGPSFSIIAGNEISLDGNSSHD